MSCPEGKIRNPDTGRCVSTKGKVGRQVLEKERERSNSRKKES